MKFKKGQKSYPHKEGCNCSKCGGPPWIKGRHHSEETKQKMREKHLGKKMSNEMRAKISLLKKGKPSPNKGKQLFWMKGNKNPNWIGGKPKCKNCHKTLSLYRNKTGMCKKCSGLITGGRNHYNWQGGITPINNIIRRSLKYREWRRNIFERDNFQCQICGQVGGELRANHIKKFSDYPASRFDVGNGITICKRCDLRFVYWHEEEWKSYFNFNLMTRIDTIKKYK